MTSTRRTARLLYVLMALVMALALSLFVSGGPLVNAAGPNLLTNGSFETGNNPPTGWTVGAGGIDVVSSSGWQPSDGSYSIDLNAFSPGTISQTFATVTGGQYQVTFDLAGNPGHGGVVTLQVSAGLNSANYSFNTAGHTTTNMGWTPQTFNFTANSGSTTLTFTSTTSGPSSCPIPNACGPALDNIAAAPVQSLTLLGGVLNGNPSGTYDRYTEVSQDGGTTWSHAVLATGHPWGLVSGTDSWEACNSSLTGCVNQTVEYRTQFSMPASFSNGQINLSVKVDNFGSVFLNGTQIAPVGGGEFTGGSGVVYNSGPLSINSLLVAGKNSLVFKVRDIGGLTGVNFNANITVDALSPVTVIDSTPAVAANNASVTVNEGQTANNSGTFQDADPSDVVVITASRGNVSQTGTNSGTWSWSFATTDGPSQSGPVTITATDSNGPSAKITFNLTVNNVAPSVSITGTNSVYYVDWTAANPGAGTASGIITLPDSSTVNVTFQALNPDNTPSFFYGAQTNGGTNYWIPSAPYISAQVPNAPPDPDIIQLSGGNNTIYKVTLSQPIVDPIMAIVSLGSASNTITYNFNSPFTIVSQGVGYWGGCATCLVQLPGNILQGTEGHGTIKFLGTYTTFQWTVPKPEVWHGFTFGIRSTDALAQTVFVNEGQTATNNGTWSDPGVNDNVQLSASIGAVVKNADGTWNWSFTTNDGPAQSQTVTITATDKDGASSSKTFPLVVNNVAPVATFNAPASAVYGDAFALSLSSPSDPSSVDTAAGFTYAFDCGNGAGFGGFSPSSSAMCTAVSTGTITVKGKIQDKDGGTTSYSASVAIAKAPLAVTANDATRVYGAANPAFTGNITGIKNGDPITATYSSAATPASAIGTYPIVPALSDGGSGKLGNYIVTLKNGTLTVNPAPLTVTANNASKTYGQTVVFAGTEFTVSGLANGDTVTSATIGSAGAAASASVGTYDIVPSNAVGTGLGNYTIAYVNGKLSVNPAPLTVTANDATRVYGAANPPFSGVISGIQNGDPITATYSSAAGPASNVGAYPIVPALSDGGSGKLGNYTITITNGTLSVTPASTASLVTTSLTPSLLGQSVTFTATVAAVAPGAGTPTGTVAFLDTTSATPVNLGTGILNAGGVATLSTSSVILGSRTITAKYAGDGNFLGSSATVTQDVFDFKVSLAPADITVGMSDAVTYTLGVTLVAGSGSAPSGAATTLGGAPADATLSGFPAALNFGATATFTLQTGMTSFGDFTLTATGAAAGGTRTTSAALHILTAQGLKNHALQALMPYKGENHKILTAISAVQDSLTAKYWINGTHLDQKSGDRVFSDEKHAVQELLGALKDKSQDDHGDEDGYQAEKDEKPLSAAAQAAARQAITDLMKADRLLALTEIKDAQAGTTLDPKRQAQVADEIARALSALGKGDTARDAGRDATAIDRYREAWKHGLKAILLEQKKPGEQDDSDSKQGSGDNQNHAGNNDK